LRQRRYQTRKRRIVRVRDLYGVTEQNEEGERINFKIKKEMIFGKLKKKTTASSVETKGGTGSKIPLNHIYTDADGVKWFEFANPLTMSAKRAIAAEIATRFAEMNLNKDQLKTLIESMKRNANSGNIVELFNLLAELEFRLEYVGEMQTMIELATSYFVIDGEDESEFSEIWKQKKNEKFKNDQQLQDFFFQKAFELTIKSSELSAQDIHDYLKKAIPANDRFNRLLRRLNSENISTR
jgi:hypothetical protein